MIIRTIFFFVIFLFFGKIWAQDVSIEVFLCENQDSRTTTQFSKLEPLNLEINPNFQLKEKDPVVAWLISFPAGFLGLHRAYLGTDTKTVLLYIVTLGGVFGIVPMIDWILLLKGIQTGDISRYVNNRKFIMWL